MAVIDTPGMPEQSIREKLEAINAQTTALLDYANGVTGAADTRLGDAVRTLADGYGQGGGGGLEFLGECTVDMSVGQYGTLYAPLPADVSENVRYIIKPVNGTITLNGTVRNPYGIEINRTGTSVAILLYTLNWQVSNTMSRDAETGVLAITGITNARFSQNNRYILYKTAAFSEEE